MRLFPTVDRLKKSDIPPAQNYGKHTILVLDGLRAIATIMVISFHIQQKVYIWDKTQQPWLSAVWTFGGSGVTLFFILSGFLLFLPYAQALLFRSAWPSAKRFYLRRVLRILPAYYIALFCIIIFSQAVYLQPDHWPQLFLFLTFFMDSTSQTFRQLNGPFWTLAIEWQFYMLLPLIALAFHASTRRLVAPVYRLLALLGCCLAVIAWGLFIRRVGLHFQHTGTPPPFVVRVALFFLYGTGGKYLETFAVGMALSLCYVFARHPQHGSAFSLWGRRSSPFVGCLGLVLFLFTATWHFYAVDIKVPAFAALAPLLPSFDWLNEMVIALAYASIMFALLFGYPLIKRPFEFRPLCCIGLISYGLYMWHHPWLDFFQTKLLFAFSPSDKYFIYAAYWILVVLVVGLIATLSYQLIEKPAMQLAQRKASQ